MARKSFFTDKIIQDPITYEFFDDHMTVTIPNGFSSFTWDKIYKVVEYKNLFMIYRSSRLANMIPKTNMKDNEIIELKNILKNAQGLKVKLKNG
ncbi:MAG: YcxB family protein [Mucilaginibacter sp.]